MKLTRRPRRLRGSPAIRRMVRETVLNVNDLIYPIFVRFGSHIREEIPSMPGIYRFTLDELEPEIREVQELGIPAIILFGIPEYKDEKATSAFEENGIVQEAIRLVKKLAPDLFVITDVCMCQYTTFGHCGIVKDGKVLNDESLEILAKIAVSHVKAGADMVAPSAMMDGQVKAIREALDAEGFTDIPIMGYSAKYASAFYGPFRDAAESAPKFGDRSTYQMDPPNWREAMREIELDIEEGADIVMVKPALPYLDIIARARERFDYPIAAYNVSGEYSLVKAAAMQGWIDEKRVTLELLTSIKRAGADLILTYFAKDVARWIG